MSRLYHGKGLREWVESGEFVSSYQKINPSKAVAMIQSGEFSQEDIADKFGVSRQRISKFISERDLRKTYKKVRRDFFEKKKEREREEENRIKTLTGIISSILQIKYDEAKQDDSLWPEVQAFERRFSLEISRKSSYSYEKLTNLFRAYKNAEDRGEKLSLEELEKISGIHFVSIGRLLSSLDKKPMYGTRKRLPSLSEDEKTRVKQSASTLEMSLADIAYFSRIPYHMVRLNISQEDIKRNSSNSGIKRFGTSNKNNSFILTYRLASQIYEARDEGYKIEEIADILNTTPEIVEYARTHIKGLAPQIKKAIKIFNPSRNSNKPYLANEELKRRKR